MGENKEPAAHLGVVAGKPVTSAEGMISYSDGEIDGSSAKESNCGCSHAP